jgi:hypothetical protein
LTRQTLVLVLAGLALRLFIIFPGPFEKQVVFLTNQADLRNYYWPAQSALKGENPYELWSSGQSGEFRADMAPLELLIFVQTISIWNDPRAIQILFALFDGVNIILLGILLTRSPLQLPFQSLYAFSPLTLYNLAMVPEDKTILLTLTCLIFWLLLSSGQVFSLGPIQTRQSWLAIIAAGLLASFKWVSIFYLLPLVVHLSRNITDFIKNAFLFIVVVVLSHLPWFPSWSYVYAFRSARIATPLHIAPAVLLNSLGIYNPWLMIITLLISLFLVYFLFWTKRTDIFETIALATTVGILWTPDMDPVHLAVVVIGLLLVVNWATDSRMLTIWVLSFLVAAVYAISTHGNFARFGLEGLGILIGAYGSVQMILLSYLLVIVVLLFYLSDKIKGRRVGKSVLVAEES